MHTIWSMGAEGVGAESERVHRGRTFGLNITERAKGEERVDGNERGGKKMIEMPIIWLRTTPSGAALPVCGEMFGRPVHVMEIRLLLHVQKCSHNKTTYKAYPNGRGWTQIDQIKLWFCPPPSPPKYTVCGMLDIFNSYNHYKIIIMILEMCNLYAILN